VKRILLKYIKYIVLVTAVYLWIQAYSPFVYREIGGKLRLFPDDYRYGDLYRLSLLPQFKEKAYDCEHEQVTEKKPINLFIIGDSFTEDPKVQLEDFPVEKYQYVHWAKSADYQLDTSEKNVLILETVERTAKEHFLAIADNFSKQKVESSNLSLRKKIEQKTTEIEKTIVPDGIEERLLHTLFNYNFFLWVRELKASLNFKVFGRTEDEVVLSKDGKHIFYADEADANNSKSAFYPIKNSEVDNFVENINQTRAKYLALGFDEVYLSIIPNKVSILSPDLGNYNHLIERIQNHPNLKVKFVDTYKIFKDAPQKYYLKSDTHWTCEGRDAWLNEVNGLLLR
jgi:hypothetical protein